MKTKLLVLSLVLALVASLACGAFAQAIPNGEAVAAAIAELNLTEAQQSALNGIISDAMPKALPLIEKCKAGDTGSVVELAFLGLDSAYKGYNVLNTVQKAQIRTAMKNNPDVKKAASAFAGHAAAVFTTDGTVKPEFLNGCMSFAGALGLTNQQITDYTALFVDFSSKNAATVASAMGGNSDAVVDAGFATFEFIGKTYNMLTPEQKLKAVDLLKNNNDMMKFVKGFLPGAGCVNCADNCDKCCGDKCDKCCGDKCDKK